MGGMSGKGWASGEVVMARALRGVSPLDHRAAAPMPCRHHPGRGEDVFVEPDSGTPVQLVPAPRPSREMTDAEPENVTARRRAAIGMWKGEMAGLTWAC